MDVKHIVHVHPCMRVMFSASSQGRAKCFGFECTVYVCVHYDLKC